MHAGAGNFSRSIQARDRSSPIEVSTHATHRVVSGWPYGNQLLSDVDVVTHTGGVDCGEAFAYLFRVQVSQVEIHDGVGPLGNLNFVGDSASNHVTRSQLSHVVVL